MSDMRTEEEQIEAIKNWWKENGTQTIVAVVLVVGGWFGYQGYQSQKQATAEQASAVYQSMLEISESKTEEDLGRRAQLLDQLKNEYSGTPYAQFAALFKAKDAVEAKDYDAAIAELTYVKESAADEALVHLANVRLARVLNELGRGEEALAVLNVEKQGAFAFNYLEAKGDVLFKLGREAEARDAYTLAKAEGLKINADQSVLELKLADLAVTE